MSVSSSSAAATTIESNGSYCHDGTKSIHSANASQEAMIVKVESHRLIVEPHSSWLIVVFVLAVIIYVGVAAFVAIVLLCCRLESQLRCSSETGGSNDG